MVRFLILFWRLLNRQILIVILTFFIGLEVASKISKYNIKFANKTNLNFDILTWRNTQNLTNKNDGLIKNGRILIKEVDLDINEKLDAFKLILLIDNLAGKNFSLLYILLLNNGLWITLLLIDDLVLMVSTYSSKSLNLIFPR